MITNNQIKYIKSLHQRKFRQKYNNFIAEGDKIAIEILKNSKYEVELIFSTQDWTTKNEEILKAHRSCHTIVDLKTMAKISALKTASSVLIVLKQQNQSAVKEEINKGHAIFLNNVQDPGNVGTIIRLSDWFGIKTIIRDSGSADFYNPKVIQATMGSFINVDLVTSEFDDLEMLSHQKIGTLLEGSPIDDFSWPDKTLLIMGSEGKGIADDIVNQLDQCLTIPGAKGRVAESLNVAMATGIVLSKMQS